MSNSEALSERFSNRNFGLWLLVSVPLFVVSVMVLDAIGAGTLIVFLAGIAYNELLNPVLEWFLDPSGVIE